MKILLILVSLVLLRIPASALTIYVDADTLKNADGTPMPVSGLVVLTAAVSNAFYGPTPDAFTGGDELVLQKWDLSSFQTPGILSNVTAELAFGGGWNEGDPLRLYWFPTLTLASAAPGAGTAFGFYTDTFGLDGSAPWVTPTEGVFPSLRFFTADAEFLNPGGSNDANAGRALFTVASVPDSTGSVAMLFGGALLAIGGVHSRKREIAARAV